MYRDTRNIVFRELALEQYTELLELAKSKKSIKTSAFYELIDVAKVLEVVNSQAIHVINKYNLYTLSDVVNEINKYAGNLDKLRKFIGDAKNCNIYHLENNELKNVDRKLFIEVCENLIDVVESELNNIRKEIKDEEY